jgi:hypothetical protein
MQKTAQTRAAALLRFDTSSSLSREYPSLSSFSLQLSHPPLPTVRIFVRLVHYIRLTELSGPEKNHAFFSFLFLQQPRTVLSFIARGSKHAWGAFAG